MKKRLEEGVHLVVDRYAFSGVAFTAAKVHSTTVTLRAMCLLALPYPLRRSSRSEQSNPSI